MGSLADGGADNLGSCPNSATMVSIRHPSGLGRRPFAVRVGDLAGPSLRLSSANQGRPATICFSASASFATAGVTAVAGAVAFKSAKGTGYGLLAVVPFLFAIQQVTEGVLWLTFDGKASLFWQTAATYFFLLVANVVWPTLVPMAVRSGERNHQRRHFLSALLVLGVGTSLAHGWALAANLAVASVTGGHIAYQIQTPWSAWVVAKVAYPIVVVLPPLLASNSALRVAGVAVLVSLIVARVAYLETAPSVWCFFAAIVSGLVVVAVRIEAASSPLHLESRPANPT